MVSRMQLRFEFDNYQDNIRIEPIGFTDSEWDGFIRIISDYSSAILQLDGKLYIPYRVFLFAAGLLCSDAQHPDRLSFSRPRKNFCFISSNPASRYPCSSFRDLACMMQLSKAQSPASSPSAGRHSAIAPKKDCPKLSSTVLFEKFFNLVSTDGLQLRIYPEKMMFTELF